MDVVVAVTFAGWLVLELALLARDWMRGKGSTTRDRGTRSLTMLTWLAAFVTASLVAARLPAGGGWQFGRWHVIAGVLVMWTGLAVRIWAIRVLGLAFRTTVEVDSGQAVVDRGPYRWVRHPAYTGMLIIAAGSGITFGNWFSLVVVIVVPLAALLRRIWVEEAILTEVLGQPYVAYQKRTKRLVPGIW